HQVVTLAQLLNERAQLREVVTVVGVTHDDVPRPGGVDPGTEGAAVPLHLDMDDAGPQPTRDLRRSVRAAIVRDDDLALDPALAQEVLRLPDARGQALGLVQAGHDDRELRRRLAIALLGLDLLFRLIGDHDLHRGRPPESWGWECGLTLGRQ